MLGIANGSFVPETPQNGFDKRVKALCAPLTFFPFIYYLIHLLFLLRSTCWYSYPFLFEALSSCNFTPGHIKKGFFGPVYLHFFTFFSCDDYIFKIFHVTAVTCKWKNRQISRIYLN